MFSQAIYIAEQLPLHFARQQIQEYNMQVDSICSLQIRFPCGFNKGKSSPSASNLITARRTNPTLLIFYLRTLQFCNTLTNTLNKKIRCSFTETG